MSEVRRTSSSGSRLSNRSAFHVVYKHIQTRSLNFAGKRSSCFLLSVHVWRLFPSSPMSHPGGQVHRHLSFLPWRKPREWNWHIFHASQGPGAQAPGFPSWLMLGSGFDAPVRFFTRSCVPRGPGAQAPGFPSRLMLGGGFDTLTRFFTCLKVQVHRHLSSLPWLMLGVDWFDIFLCASRSRWGGVDTFYAFSVSQSSGA